MKSNQIYLDQEMFRLDSGKFCSLSECDLMQTKLFC